MTPWVRRLIIANVAVFLLTSLQPTLLQLLAFRPVLFLERPWTIVTSMFVHEGFLHIFFNMLTLYWFGPRLEERLGGREFIILYFLSGFGGALLSFVQPMIPIVGASGAIMGVAAAYARYWPRQKFYMYGVVPVEAWLLILLYIGWDVGGVLGFGDLRIAHFAHLGGAAVGYAYVVLREVWSPGRRWRRQVTPPPARVFGNGDSIRRWRETIPLDDLHPINRDEVLRLLDKAQDQGVRSLTQEERATLERFAKRPA